MDKVKNKWIYFRLMLGEHFVGFKKIKSGSVSQYSHDGVTGWNKEVIFHDDGVRIDDPKSVIQRG